MLSRHIPGAPFLVVPSPTLEPRLTAPSFPFVSASYDVHTLFSFLFYSPLSDSSLLEHLLIPEKQFLIAE